MSYTHATLNTKKVPELTNIAKQNGCIIASKSKKSDLIDIILRKQNEIRPVIKISNTTTFHYIIHIADIHIRLLERHDEYLQVFNNLYQTIAKHNQSNPDTKTLIVIAGDLFESKDAIKPETIIIAQNFLDQLSNLAPTIIIGGNHDMIEANTERVDTISATVHKMPHIYYLKNSGAYIFGNINFTISSLYDKRFITFDEIKHINSQNINSQNINSQNINIAIYHGTIDGSRGANNILLSNSAENTTTRYRKKSEFAGFDIVLLGDIHKYQHFEPNIAYAGSLIQQNFGEPVEGHGAIIWNLQDKSHKFHQIANDYSFVTIDVINNSYALPLSFTPNIYLRVRLDRSSTTKYEEILAQILQMKINIITAKHIHVCEPLHQQTHPIAESNENIPISHIDDTPLFIELAKSFNISDKMMADLLSLHTMMKTSHPTLISPFAGQSWQLLELSFKNIFIFGNDHTNTIRFNNTTMRGKVTGIIGPNATGKSNLMNVITFALFKRINEDYEIHQAIHNGKKEYNIECKIRCGNKYYHIKKGGKITSQGNVRSHLDVYEYNPADFSTITNLTSTGVKSTDKILEERISLQDNFTLSNVYSNTYLSSFLDLSAKDKIEKLKKFLNIDLYDSFEKIIKSRNNEHAGNIQILTKQINEITEKFDSQKLSILQESINDNRKQLKQIAADIESINDKYNYMSTERIDLNNKYVEEQKKYIHLQNNDIKIDPMPQIESMLKQHPNIETILSQNLDELKDQYYRIKNNIKSIVESAADSLDDEQNQLIENATKIEQILQSIQTQNQTLLQNKSDTWKTIDENRAKLINVVISDYSNELEELAAISNRGEILEYQEIDIDQYQREYYRSQDKLILDAPISPYIATETELNDPNITPETNVKHLDMIKELQSKIAIINQEIGIIENRIKLFIDVTFQKSQDYDADIEQLKEKIKLILPLPTLPKMTKAEINDEISKLKQNKSTLMETSINKMNVQVYLQELDEAMMISDKYLINSSTRDHLRELLRDIKSDNVDKKYKELEQIMTKIRDLQSSITIFAQYDEIISKNNKINQENMLILKEIDRSRYSQLFEKIQILKQNNDDYEQKAAKMRLEYDKNVQIINQKIQNRMNDISAKIDKSRRRNRLLYLISIEKLHEKQKANVEHNLKINELIDFKMKQLSIIQDGISQLAIEMENNQKMKINIEKKIEIVDITRENRKNRKIADELLKQIDIQKAKNRYDELKIAQNEIVIKNEIQKNNQIINENLYLLRAQINGIEDQIFAADKHKNGLCLRKEKIEIQLGIDEEQVLKFNENQVKLIELQRQRNDLEVQMSVNTQYLRIIGYNCLPSRIIKDKLIHIERHVNYFLAGLTDISAVFEFSAQKGDLDVKIHKHKYSHSYHQLSGYERFVINIAFKCALSKFSHTSKSEIFMIDEGLDCIDSAHMKQLPELLNYIKCDHSQVFIVSHAPEVEKMVDQKININNFGDYSTIGEFHYPEN